MSTCLLWLDCCILWMACINLEIMEAGADPRRFPVGFFSAGFPSLSDDCVFTVGIMAFDRTTALQIFRTADVHIKNPLQP